MKQALRSRKVQRSDTLKMFVAAEKTSADSPWSPKADGVVRIAFCGWAVDA